MPKSNWYKNEFQNGALNSVFDRLSLLDIIYSKFQLPLSSDSHLVVGTLSWDGGMTVITNRSPHRAGNFENLRPTRARVKIEQWLDFCFKHSYFSNRFWEISLVHSKTNQNNSMRVLIKDHHVLSLQHALLFIITSILLSKRPFRHK